MTEESSLIVQGGVATVAIAFLQSAVLRMIPYAWVALPLIALDLMYGIRAARFRKERVRLSTALRRSTTKLFTYTCWLILASAVALSFHKEWLEWVILGIVFLNEFLSIIGNYLECKGVDFSVVNLWKLLFRKGAEKVGVEITEEDIDNVVKPRDPKTGRFIKTKK